MWSVGRLVKMPDEGSQVGTPAPAFMLSRLPWDWPDAPSFPDGLAAEMTWHACSRFAVEDLLALRATVSDVYTLRGRICTTTSVKARVAGQEGPAFTASATLSSPPRPIAGKIANRDRSVVSGLLTDLQGHRSTEGPPHSTLVDLEASRAFWSGWFGDQPNIHTSRSVAKTVGLPNFLVGSSHLLSLGGEYLVSVYGDRLFPGGRLSIKFVAPSFGDRQITLAPYELVPDDAHEGKPTAIRLEYLTEDTLTAIAVAELPTATDAR